MPDHAQFEQLCTLAAAGELDLHDRQALKEHLDACASCRGVLADMEEIHAQWLPEHQGFEMTTDPQFDLYLRNAILKRAAKEGARFSRDARQSSRAPGIPGFLPASSRQWAFAAAAVVVFAVGIASIVSQSRPQGAS